MARTTSGGTEVSALEAVFSMAVVECVLVVGSLVTHFTDTGPPSSVLELGFEAFVILMAAPLSAMLGVVGAIAGSPRRGSLFVASGVCVAYLLFLLITLFGSQFHVSTRVAAAHACRMILLAVVGAIAGGTGATVLRLRQERRAARIQDPPFLWRILRYSGMAMILCATYTAVRVVGVRVDRSLMPEVEKRLGKLGAHWSLNCGLLDLSLAYSAKFGDDDLPRLVGLGPINRIDLHSTGITGRGLSCLKPIASLSELNLSETAVGSRELQEVAQLVQLERLFLSHTRIDDSGMNYLRGLRNLTYLDLSKTDVNDGLDCLQPMVNLKTLNLSGTKIGSGELKQLAALRRLERLYLSSTNIDDSGIHFLSELQDITELSLIDTAVSDDGVAALRGMGKLQCLHLLGTRVTDSGLTSIKEMRNLRDLWVSVGDRVTERGLADLHRANPQLRINGKVLDDPANQHKGSANH